MRRRLLIFIMIVACMPAFASAADPGLECVPNAPTTKLCNPVRYAGDWQEFAYKIIQILTSFFLFVGVMRVAFSGFQMMMSGGNSEAVNKAKTSLQWSVLSITLALFAFVIVQALATYLGVIDLRGSSEGNKFIQNPLEADDFGQLLTRMLEGFLGITGLFAIGMIIFGGFKYITALGNEEQAASAKATLQWATIGLIIILLSYVIVRATLTFFAG